jgi:putative transposase
VWHVGSHGKPVLDCRQQANVADELALPYFRMFDRVRVVRYSERLADNDIVASVGSKGDSYDNAMTESFNGLYKWELIYPQGPWQGLDDIESATMTYVNWFNHRRLHGEITSNATYTIPAEAEAEAIYCRQNNPASEAIAQ